MIKKTLRFYRPEKKLPKKALKQRRLGHVISRRVLVYGYYKHTPETKHWVTAYYHFTSHDWGIMGLVVIYWAYLGKKPTIIK